MLFMIRLLLARSLVHLFEGLRFGDWLRLLRREGFRIDPIWWPRAFWITAMSLWNSLAARAVERRFSAAISATPVKAPLFILGHYRSGTTLLHELLSIDDRFASPNRYQTFNPRTFLGTERWLAPLVEPFMLPRRVQEDEVAALNLTLLSPYMDWCFPRSRFGYRRYLSFEGAEPSEVAAWSEAMTSFLKALTLKNGRSLVLKSPPHTARVRLILKMFPDARFVHIQRDPYAVFLSTLGLLKAVQPVFRLQGGPTAIDVEDVLLTYTAMYDAYFADRPLIPNGQLVEVAYEELEVNPISEVRAIYGGLSMGDFETFRPKLEAYVASIAGYRKNRHPPLDDQTREKVARAWSRSFEAWSYPR
ncbi:MAG: sulfotransferase [Isosphaeraceae bacterium]